MTDVFFQVSTTMQKVDNQHHLSLPLFYPDYKPGCMKSRSSKDVQFFAGSSNSSRSQTTQNGNHKSRSQHWVSNPSRQNETSLKSCLRKSSKENFKDTDNDGDVRDFKDTDNDPTFTAKKNRSKFPKKKWTATAVAHKDPVDDSKDNSETVKMKGFSYPRFRYPLRFHYGSAAQPKSGLISAIPAGFRSLSFYSTLPRRQRRIAPGSLSSDKNRRGKDDKRKQETNPSPEKIIEVENDKNSRSSSTERELNGVYHIVHETKTVHAAHDTNVEQESRITEGDKARTAKNQRGDDDEEALEINDPDPNDSSSRSSRSLHSNRSEESIKEAGSGSDDERLKNQSGSSDDSDQKRSRKKEKKKNTKKKKKGDKGKLETKYAADFDEDNSDVLSED